MVVCVAAGSEDGTAQVWHLRSRQAMHALQAPSKLPVTCALVLPRPPHLAAGGGAAGGRTGPKRLAPLAPLVKYTGMAGALKPWESSAVILDGANPLLLPPPTASRCLAGFGSAPLHLSLLPPQGTEQAWLAGGAEAGVEDAAVQGAGAAHVSVQPAPPAGNGGTGKAAGAEGAEVAELRAQLEAARKEAQAWQALHAQLHAFCVERVVGGAGGAAPALLPG